MSLSSHWWRILKFLAAGGLNTLLTWFAYLILLNIFPYYVSYTVSYVIGVCAAYVLYRFFVFKQKAINHGLMLIFLIYVVQYMLGVGVVIVWAEIISGSIEIAPIISVCITYPLIYISTNIIFKNS